MTVFKNRSTFLATAAISGLLLAVAAPASAKKDGRDDYEPSSSGSLTIYFTRHGEKQTVVTKLEDVPNLYITLESNDDVIDQLMPNRVNASADRLDEVCGDDKCAEELSDRGELYAELLADWFDKRNIIEDIDAVYASHKTRTQQTVQPTAKAADTTVVQLPMLNPDGSMATELNPQSTSPSECATLAKIAEAHADYSIDTIVIAGHSGTLYDIMGPGGKTCDGLGLDTYDMSPKGQSRFPKDGDKKVANFGDLWKVVIRPNGTAVFKWRKSLKPVSLSVVDTVR